MAYSVEQKALLVQAVIDRLERDQADADSFPRPFKDAVTVFIGVGRFGTKANPATVEQLMDFVGAQRASIYRTLNQLVCLLPHIRAPFRLRRVRLRAESRSFGYWLESIR